MPRISSVLVRTLKDRYSNIIKNASYAADDELKKWKTKAFELYKNELVSKVSRFLTRNGYPALTRIEVTESSYNDCLTISINIKMSDLEKWNQIRAEYDERRIAKCEFWKKKHRDLDMWEAECIRLQEILTFDVPEYVEQEIRCA